MGSACCKQDDSLLPITQQDAKKPANYGTNTTIVKPTPVIAGSVPAKPIPGPPPSTYIPPSAVSAVQSPPATIAIPDSATTTESTSHNEINVAIDTAIPKIKHIFVLMMENRSFEHIFPSSSTVSIDEATSVLKRDPPHEFEEVRASMNDDKMNGFAKEFAAKYPKDAAIADVVNTPVYAPVMHQLASKYALCEQYFSSLPGPTWPNRFFVHAGTSGGLCESPSTWKVATSVSVNGFAFEHGTLFDALETKGVHWAIYHGDFPPQSLALKGINFLGKNMFDYAKFAKHVQKDYASYERSYTFIEPDYGAAMTDFHGGNSMHPVSQFGAGEALIQNVLEAIQAVPDVWKESLLIVTMDEHGGFADPQFPPPAAQPADKPLYEKDNPKGYRFEFNRYGIRVPALLMAPGIAAGTRMRDVFDHTSIIRTVLDEFNLNDVNLGARVAQANNLLTALRHPGVPQVQHKAQLVLEQAHFARYPQPLPVTLRLPSAITPAATAAADISQPVVADSLTVEPRAVEVTTNTASAGPADAESDEDEDAGLGTRTLMCFAMLAQKSLHEVSALMIEESEARAWHADPLLAVENVMKLLPPPSSDDDSVTAFAASFMDEDDTPKQVRKYVSRVRDWFGAHQQGAVDSRSVQKMLRSVCKPKLSDIVAAKLQVDRQGLVDAAKRCDELLGKVRDVSERQGEVRSKELHVMLAEVRQLCQHHDVTRQLAKQRRGRRHRNRHTN
eukprot:TRINITY_DN8429_c0_g1_i1.p1 TRINITY_DN8429_c0_g1~~TRINITY_DN8429_c0_g1_i1.p1  ORF type:complete len:729 (+),score=162.01 TRINITY_DN8429_c0_g1_i1:75-2261(+)